MNRLTYQTSILRILNENLNLSNYYYFLFIIFLMIIFVINIPYTRHYDYVMIKSDGYRLIVDDNFFPIKNKYLYIEHKKYSYNILEISEPYINNNKTYYDIAIDINIIDYKENQNVFNVSIIKDKSTLLNDFLRKLKKII